MRITTVVALDDSDAETIDVQCFGDVK